MTPRRTFWLGLLAAAVLYAPAPAALTRHWKCDENAANTTVTDTTGNDDGTLNGGNTADKQTGAGPGGSITWSFDLDGTDDFISNITISNASGAAFSFSCWVKLDGADTGCIIWGRTSNSGSTCTISAEGTLRVRLGSTNTDFTVPSFGSTNWHHVFVTKNTSSDLVRVWVDGTESVTGGLTNAGTTAATNIGTAATGSLDHNGKITQIRVWDSDESANVATWYAEGVTSGKLIRIVTEQSQ